MAQVMIIVEDTPDGNFNIASNPNWQDIIAKHKSGHGLSFAESVALGIMANVKNAVDEYKKTGKFNIIPERPNGRGLIYNITEI